MTKGRNCSRQIDTSFVVVTKNPIGFYEIGQPLDRIKSRCMEILATVLKLETDRGGFDTKCKAPLTISDDLSRIQVY
jgi:hypothetical protein